MFSNKIRALSLIMMLCKSCIASLVGSCVYVYKEYSYVQLTVPKQLQWVYRHVGISNCSLQAKTMAYLINIFSKYFRCAQIAYLLPTGKSGSHIHQYSARTNSLCRAMTFLLHTFSNSTNFKNQTYLKKHRRGMRHAKGHERFAVAF